MWVHLSFQITPVWWSHVCSFVQAWYLYCLRTACRNPHMFEILKDDAQPYFWLDGICGHVHTWMIHACIPKFRTPTDALLCNAQTMNAECRIHPCWSVTTVECCSIGHQTPRKSPVTEPLVITAGLWRCGTGTAVLWRTHLHQGE